MFYVVFYKVLFLQLQLLWKRNIKLSYYGWRVIHSQRTAIKPVQIHPNLCEPRRQHEEEPSKTSKGPACKQTQPQLLKATNR